MELLIVTAVPFVLAMTLALPIVRVSLGKSTQTLISSVVMAALFISVISLYPLLHSENAIVQSFDWVPSLGISLSFYLDGLSLLFALIITGIGALIFFYAGQYFDDAAEHNRFMIWLSSFAGAMLAVVLSGNLLMMFIAWELTSITSFVLIGFQGASDVEAREGAFKALFVTGGGSLALIIGIVALSVGNGPNPVSRSRYTMRRRYRRYPRGDGNRSARLVYSFRHPNHVRRIHQKRPIPLSFLATRRDERAHASERLSAQRDHGESRHLPFRTAIPSDAPE